MSTPAHVFEPNELLRELYEVVAEADNSCSEPDDFLRGMQFMFDLVIEKLGRSFPALPKQDSTVPQAAPARLPTPRPG